MKRFSIIFFVSAVALVAATGCEKDKSSGGGSGSTDGKTTADLIEAVDLGLSVDWGTLNLGATDVFESGDSYRWGDTQPVEEYDITCPYAEVNGEDGKITGLSKYNSDASFGKVDNLSRLQMIDDAATVELGVGWRMPTKAEFEELIEKCLWIPETADVEGSVKELGYKVVAQNGKYIHIPSANAYMRYERGVASLFAGYAYWTSDRSEEYSQRAYYLLSFSAVLQEGKKPIVSNYPRNYRMAIRPVKEK